MGLKQANSRLQGNVGIGSAMQYFTSLGWVVSTPLTDAQKYDLIVDNGERLYRVQVKTTFHKTKHDVYQVMIKTCGGNQSFNKTYLFDKNRVDLIFILTDNGDRWLIPSEKISNKTTLNLGEVYSTYKLPKS